MARGFSEMENHRMERQNNDRDRKKTIDNAEQFLRVPNIDDVNQRQGFVLRSTEETIREKEKHKQCRDLHNECHGNNLNITICFMPTCEIRATIFLCTTARYTVIDTFYSANVLRCLCDGGFHSRRSNILHSWRSKKRFVILNEKKRPNVFVGTAKIQYNLFLFLAAVRWKLYKKYGRMSFDCGEYDTCPFKRGATITRQCNCHNDNKFRMWFLTANTAKLFKFVAINATSRSLHMYFVLLNPNLPDIKRKRGMGHLKRAQFAGWFFCFYRMYEKQTSFHHRIIRIVSCA